MSAELTANAPQRRPHEYYSPERKAEVLALLDANNGNVLRTANQTGITHTTIQYWEENRERFDHLRQQKKTSLVEKLDFHIDLALDSAQKKVEEATYAQLMTGAAIAIDKRQLLMNLPTSITEHVNSDSITVVLQSVLNELTLTD